MTALSRSERKSLAYHHAVADKLRANPALVATAKKRLEWYRTRNAAGAIYYDAWQRLLEGPLNELIATMLAEDERACALRQENPFVDVVPQTERARIYREVAESIDRQIK